MNVVGRFLLADGSPKALTGSMTIPGSCQRPVDAPGADPAGLDGLALALRA